jgi:hypothetical protein
MNGIVQYYGLSAITRSKNRLLLRLGIACIAIPAWYTVMRTQRMEHAIPNFVAGFLASELALGSPE